MVGAVNRRWLNSLIYVLVLGQMLLSAPMVSALGGAIGGTGAEMPCADSMPQAPDRDSCPCCPDGNLGATACLTSCTAMLAAISAVDFPLSAPEATLLPDEPLVHLARASEPPLKPPPIV